MRYASLCSLIGCIGDLLGKFMQTLIIVNVGYDILI